MCVCVCVRVVATADIWSCVVQLHCETSGAEALKWISSSKVLPDLILLDCMMPGMSGDSCSFIHQKLLAQKGQSACSVWSAATVAAHQCFLYKFGKTSLLYKFAAYRSYGST